MLSLLEKATIEKLKLNAKIVRNKEYEMHIELV